VSCVAVSVSALKNSTWSDQQFRDGERVDSSTGTAERLDAVKRGRSRCRRADTTAARLAAKCERKRRRRSCETVEQTAARRAADRSRWNRYRSAKTSQQTKANGLHTVVVQGGVEVVCITLGNYHVEPQSRIVARFYNESCVQWPQWSVLVFGCLIIGNGSVLHRVSSAVAVV